VRTPASAKGHTDRAAVTKTPPASHLREPTLCTRRDPAIPRPPAAGAAAGGEESTGSRGGEVVREGSFRNRLSAL
jgi:hypothetical protein